MKSHIQIPRVVFNEFVNDKHYFYKYEVENNRISRGFPRTTYTQENYYSEAIERALNKHVETPLKELLNYALQLPLQEIFEVDNHILEIAKIYFKSLIARSPQLLKSVIENSIYLQFMSAQEQHDIVVDYAMTDHRMNRFEEEYDFTFMVNDTLTPYVIPTRGLYEFSINGVQCINVPLTPWCTLLLKEKGKRILRENGDNVAAIIPKGMDDVVLRINGFAFAKQKRDATGYVVCYDKELLNRLKQST